MLYERAFHAWLVENQFKFIYVDETKRSVFGRAKIKSFDFLVYRPDESLVLVELKGRLFKGNSLEKMRNLECWVTLEDVEGLIKWQEIFGPEHTAAVVFAYRIEQVDADLDGAQAFVYDNQRFVFFVIRIEDYLKSMKSRSPKWQTVTLPADEFRALVLPVREILV